MPNKYTTEWRTTLARGSKPVEEICRELGLSSQADLLAVGRRLKGYGLFAFMKAYKFDNEEHRAELALRMAETDPFNSMFNSGLEGIKLTSTHRREAVFIAAKGLGPKAMGDLSACGLSDPIDQRKLMFILASTAPGCCVESRDLLNSLDEPTRIRLAETIAKSDPGVLLVHIDRFGITDESVRIALFTKSFNPAIERGSEESLDVAAELGDEVDQRAILRGVAETFHEITTNWFGDKNTLPNFSKHAVDFGIKYHSVASMLDAARKEPDGHLAEALCPWTHYANLLFLNLDIPKSAEDAVGQTLSAIFHYRKPDARYPLTDLLAETLSAGAIETFAKVSQQLARPRSVVFRPVLCAMAQEGSVDGELLAPLGRLLSTGTLKDSRRRDCVMNGLLALQQAELDPAEKQRVLTVLTPGSVQASDGKAFAAAMQDLGDFLSLIAEPALADKARSKLPSVQQPSDLQRALGEMLFFVLDRNGLDDSGKSCTPQEFVSRLQNYNDGLREPSPIMGYAGKLFCDLEDGDEKRSILSVLNRYVDVTVLSDDPQAFVRAKNDLSSEHLQNAMAIDRAATDRWLHMEREVEGVFSNSQALAPEDVDVVAYLEQRIVRDAHVAPGTYPAVEQVLKGEITLAQARATPATGLRKNEADLLQLLDASVSPADKVKLLGALIPALEIEDPRQKEEFENNLTDLKTLLKPDPQARRDFSEWRVQFKHDAEAYLRCGMLGGSCQNVHGTADLNKALMGYVMQGKNRMLAVTSPDGTLQARCIVRLGIDAEAKRLVMHLEDSYVNAGVPKECDQVLLGFAKDLARDIGVPLVTHSDDFGAGALYPNQIHFHPDTAACEYVDSEGLRVVNSREGYSFEKTRLVDTST